MAEFSYESDIAPMRGGNFYSGSVPVGSDYQRFLTMKSLVDKDSRNRIQELEFERQKMQLENAREAARLEREALTVVPEVTKALTSVMNDPSLDDATKTIKVAELKFQYAGPAKVSKTIGSLFATAEGTNEARKADRERVNALINPLIQTGQSETLKKVLEGKNVPMANDYIIAAEAVGASKKAEAEQKGARAQRTELLKRETAQQTTQIGMLNNYMSTLRKLAPQEADVGGDIGTLKGGPTTTAVPQAQPFKFDTEDRIQIEEMMRNLNPMLEDEDLSKYSDENLYRSAVRSTSSSLKKLSGFQSGFPSNRFLANPPQ
jgi:hypothetical protein